MKKQKGKMVVATHDDYDDEKVNDVVIARENSPAMAAVEEKVQSTLRVLMVGALLLTIGTLAFYHIPGMIKKDVAGNHLINSFYCAAITLATVGYGDICPGEEMSHVGKLFLVVFVFSGLGMFCGPITSLASMWKLHIPGGLMALASVTIGVGVMIFTTFEELDQMEAIYASVITGATIGYGDVTPKTDMGKIAVALYAIASVQAVAILLEPGRIFLEDLCRVPSKQQYDDKKAKNKAD